MLLIHQKILSKIVSAYVSLHVLKLLFFYFLSLLNKKYKKVKRECASVKYFFLFHNKKNHKSLNIKLFYFAFGGLLGPVGASSGNECELDGECFQSGKQLEVGANLMEVFLEKEKVGNGCELYRESIFSGGKTIL